MGSEEADGLVWLVIIIQRLHLLWLHCDESLALTKDISQILQEAVNRRFSGTLLNCVTVILLVVALKSLPAHYKIILQWHKASDLLLIGHS